MVILPTNQQYIEITPGVLGGKPRMTGRRIAVEQIAVMYLEMGQSVEEIARDYNLSPASVHAAMVYYYEHREEIERHRAKMLARIEQIKRNSSPSKLQEKLRELRGE